MPLTATSLSHACASIRSFLATNLADVPQDVTVQIGSPGEADADSGNILNLFFYRFDPTTFGSVSIPGEPLRIRLFCLISAFGSPLDQISSGENELRMLGEVMRLFHENPILPESNFSGQDAFRSEVVFHPLTEDQVSQFWNVSGDQGFRPSIAYEFSLIPIVPETRRVEPPRAGAVGAQSHGTMDQRYRAATIDASAPRVPAIRIDLNNPLWQPQITFVISGVLLQSQAITKAQATGLQAEIWCAGDPGEALDFVWESWRPDVGWAEVPGTTSLNSFSEELNPEAIPPAGPNFPQTIPLPDLFADVDRGQLLLYARRTVSLGGKTQEIRSNPLLISIHQPAS